MKFMNLFFFIVFCFSLAVKADIVFIDLNNSEGEVAAARRAAEKRDEKLLVYPKIDSKTALNLKKINSEIGRLNSHINQKCSERQVETNVAKYNNCLKIYRELRILYKEEETLLKSSKFNADKLNEVFKNLNSQKIKISSLIISGHDGNGHFNGTYGDLDEQALSGAIKNNTPLGEDLRSVFLWGCYTATPDSLSGMWKDTFPNAEMIAGFDGMAPAGTRMASASYLEDALVQEKKLTAAKDLKQLKTAFSKIRDIKLMNASICVGDNLVSNKGGLDLKEKFKVCSTISKDEIRRKYLCYKNAQAPQCANPPTNTSNSELRDLYNLVQITNHCFEGEPDRPWLSILLPLIYFENVKNNFVKFNENFIDKFNALLEKLGAPKEALLTDILTSTRAEILNKLNRAGDFIQNQKKNIDYYSNPLTPDLESAASALHELQSSLGGLQPYQIPFAWVEPNASVPSPSNNYNILKPERLLRERKFFENTRGLYLVNKKYRELTNLNLSREKLDSDMRAYVESLKQQDYPHEEGKKLFIEGLERNFPKDQDFNIQRSR